MNRNKQNFNETELKENSLSEQLLSITYILHMEVSSMTNSTNSWQNHVEDLNSLFIFRFHFLKCCIPSAVSCLWSLNPAFKQENLMSYIDTTGLSTASTS